MLKSIVLMSGGLDSAVSLAHALRESEVSLCLTFNYGQQAAQKEIEAAANLAAYYHLRHQVVEIPFLGEITDTALVRSEAALPEPEFALLDEPVAAAANAAQVWVPNRNGLFINIAAAFAEACGARQVVCGFNREEAAAFPDNSADFIQAANSALFYSTKNQVKVISYTKLLSKADIVRLGMRRKVPFQYVWSCYRGGEKMCGRCESCLRFKRAAKEADLNIEQIAFQEV
ncbi:MAG: 7-cyano-7-deazaguanine synthase QueC [Desulfotomaculaceae bacterium]|nr:7-cyano-7-deazaguanine synthase QueC [Desulfotomaculaceae bacterium]